MVLRAAIVLAVCVLALASCNGDDDGNPTATPTATATATASPGVTVTPTATPTAAPTATGTPNGGGGTPPPPPSETPPANDAEVAAGAALDALARWLGPVGDPASITVSSVEPVTWPNGCLGLDRIGQACTLALVPGYRVELTLANATYELRTDATGDLVLWSPRLQILAHFVEASANVVQLRSDDGGTIEAQPVFGSLYGVDLAELSEGDPVAVGLVDAPQSGGLLLVWLDPA